MMKRLVVPAAALVVLSACSQGVPQSIDPLELDPVLGTTVSANETQCTTVDKLITAEMVAQECVVQLNRQGYPRVNVRVDQCTDLDMNMPENSARDGANWIVKVTGKKVMIEPLTRKALTLMAETDPDGKTEPGIYFTSNNGESCS